MSDALTGLCALLLGTSSGAVFFGALWWTVRNGTTARNPAVWFPVSFLLRASLVMVDFYYVAAHGWQDLVLCSGGFLIARGLTVRLLRVPSPGRHAS